MAAIPHLVPSKEQTLSPHSCINSNNTATTAMPPKASNYFFRPPPETFSIFDDLVDDEDEEANNPTREEPQVSSDSIPPNHEPNTHLADLFKSSHQALSQDQCNDDHEGEKEDEDDEEEDGDAPAVFLNRTRHCRIPKGRRLPKYIRIPQYKATSRQYIVQAPASREQKGREENHCFPSAPSPQRLPEPYPAYAPTHMRTAGGERLSVLETNVFMSSAQRKRIEQLERIGKTESDLRMLLGEEGSSCSANERTKLQGKLLHIQALRNKLESGGAEHVLNSSEGRILYEAGRLVERRRVMNEMREFERLARATATAGADAILAAGETTTGRGKKRARADDTAYGEYGLTRSVAAAWSVSPTYHPTVGGKSPSQSQPESKRQRIGSVDVVDDDGEEDNLEEDEGEDEEKEEEEDQERKQYGGKTIDEGHAFHVGQYDVDAVLRGDEDHEMNDEKESEGGDDDDDDHESSESSTGSDAGEEMD